MTVTSDAEARPRGLSRSEVAERVSSRQANAGVMVSSRSWLAIVRTNVFTRFNALLGGMFVVILVVGPIQDGMFGIIIALNTLIGVAQEIRARRTLDRLALLNEPKARVIRDATATEIPEADVVIDDVIDLRRGDQVVVDGDLLDSSGLEVDESLLSGEAEPVTKARGSKVLSGSTVVAGDGLMRATAVGSHSFAQGLASEARRFSLVRSELQEANNKILRLVTWAIVPVAALLTWSQLSGTLGVQDALRGSVAGVANMIPEGLVLLTSLAYGVGAVRLAKRSVLIRELPAVEGLARVDVLCIDKTGTLTTGALEPLEVRTLDPGVPAGSVLAGLARAEMAPTASLKSLAALSQAGEEIPLTCTDHVAFSSERRWSAASFEGLGSFVLGAPEAVAGPRPDPELVRQLEEESRAGHRVLLLARAPAGLTGRTLPPDLAVVAMAILAEQIRPDASRTLAYLRDQGVTVKVISGDNPETVASIAAAAGLGATDPIDATTLPESAGELARVVETHQVFGRVGPRQKRAMVAALQSAGHVVAMTGDGVNDVLALRDADLGIAMGSGSAASRAAGRVVLLDDSFAVLPTLLAEGRRVLANVERVSKLFVTKTVYAALLAVAIGIARVPYPFYPRNFTVISTLTIGVPAFFLALPPASTRSRTGYLRRVTAFVIPTGLIVGAATLVTYLVDRDRTGGTPDARTTSTLVLGACGLWILARLARPFAAWKVLLVAGLASMFALAVLLPAAREFLALQATTPWNLVLAAVVSASAIWLLEFVWRTRLGGAHSGPREEDDEVVTP